NYHFNQGVPAGSNGAVTTLTDAANANDGTLVNFVLSGSSSNWIAPGAVVSGSTAPATALGSLTVLGNGNNIPAGSTTPTISNHTDFGTISTRTFVLHNVGTGTLYINNIQLSGASGALYTVTSATAATVVPSASVSMVIAFTPSAVG